jgi:hypothetical protein
MKLVNTDSYKVVVFHFEDDHGNDYKVTYNESYDDIFTTEWLIQDENDKVLDVLDSNYETLITLSKNKLYENEN